MKKLLAMLIFFIFSSAVFASPIKHLIFFGDSLTDDGNLYLMLDRQIPAFPPYFKGRFANGITWAEHVGKAAYDRVDADYRIFAYGGATADNTNPLVELTLAGQVSRYLNDPNKADSTTSLFFIWIGGNDYLNDHETDPDLLTSRVVSAVGTQVDRLIEAGAQNIVLINLPDFTRGPIGKNDPKEVAHLQKAIMLHNKKMNQLVTKTKVKNVNVVEVNIDEFWTDFLNNISDYNRKYDINITNTTDPCFNPFVEQNKDVNADTTLSPNARKLLRSSKEFSYIATPPTTRLDVMRNHCDQPSSYVFWDVIHPTDVAHRVIGKVVFDKITAILE